MKFLISPPLPLVNFRRGVVLQVGYAVLPSHFIADSLSTRGVCLIIPIYMWYREVWNKSLMFWTNKVILCLTFLLWFLHFITLNYGHKVGFVFLRIWNYTLRGDHLRMTRRNCCNSRIWMMFWVRWILILFQMIRFASYNVGNKISSYY